MYKMGTIFFKTLPLVTFDQINDLTGILLLKGFQRKQTFPILGQPHRYHGHTFQSWQISHQLFDGILQFSPVIESLTENDLAIHTNSGLKQPIHLFQRFSGKTIVQHFAAKLGIHGLEGNIDR